MFAMVQLEHSPVKASIYTSTHPALTSPAAMPKRHGRAFWSCGLLKKRPIKPKPQTHHNSIHREEQNGESAPKVGMKYGEYEASKTTTPALEPPVLFLVTTPHRKNLTGILRISAARK
jgi:hypothetical protein